MFSSAPSSFGGVDKMFGSDCDITRSLCFGGVDKMFGSDCDIIKSLCYCECCSSGVVTCM